ncbi:thiosulfate:glutathione sulfurtransferase isoform X2 [Camelus dromedarius]|uniref:thiosulfate:glutathione sulfurtransferase isoform X2 n=1 Tax=Camelus dromedarius TaxID=9838 RepID=UPI00311A4B0F
MLLAPRGRAWATLLKLAFAARTMAGEPTVSLPELRSLLAAGRARLIDVRSREEAAAGTIPGALNIPGPDLPGSTSEPEIAKLPAFHSILSTPPPSVRVGKCPADGASSFQGFVLCGEAKAGR